MPLPKLKLSFTFTDESEQVIETRLFRCTADEIAFERRYGFPAASRSVVGLKEIRAAGDDEDARLAALAGMAVAERADVMRSEWTAFFAWCVWNRNAAQAGNPTAKFDDWLTTLAALDLDTLVAKPETNGVDPTSVALSG